MYLEGVGLGICIIQIILSHPQQQQIWLHPLHAVGRRDGPVLAEKGRPALVQEGGRAPLPQRHLPRPLPVLRLVAVDNLPGAEVGPHLGVPPAVLPLVPAAGHLAVGPAAHLRLLGGPSVPVPVHFAVAAAAQSRRGRTLLLAAEGLVEPGLATADLLEGHLVELLADRVADLIGR